MDAPSTSRNKRWAPVSGSANAEDGYKEQCKKTTAEWVYEYECWCRPPFPTGEDGNGSDDSDEEDEDDDKMDEDSDDGLESDCDGGKTCLCHKSPKEHLDHPWILTKAGRHKFFTQYDMMSLRCPDNFNMHTFSDHEGHGAIEVTENLLIDFVEADNNWREQWVICEAMGFFLLTDMVEAMMGIDDPESVSQLYHLVARTFLSMLARLERQGLLFETSEVQNLGLIMSLYMKIAADLRNDIDWDGVLFDNKDEKTESVEVIVSDPSGPDGATKTTTYKFCISNLDGIICAYANKYAIPLVGPSNIDELAVACETDGVELPPAGCKTDPFDCVSGFAWYKDHCGRRASARAKPKIGGDEYDITTMSSAERKAQSINGRDPLTKRELNMLKEGRVMQLA